MSKRIEPTPTIPTPEGESDFNLEEWIKTESSRQYDEQVEILNKLNIIESLVDSDEMGVVGIDGKEYPIPTKETIADEIRRDPEKYQTKIEQGFTVLNLVPFASSLDHLIDIMRKRLVKHHQEGELLDTSGEPLELNEENPLEVDEKIKGKDVAEEAKGFRYYPKKFDQFYVGDNGGKTKQEILDQNRDKPFNGWNVQLLEDLPNLPRLGEEEEINGRKQIGDGKRPTEYLKIIQELSEQGIIPEDWIIYFITYLEKTNQVIDDWGGKGFACMFIGVHDIALSFVPAGSFNRQSKRVYFLSGDIERADMNCSTRPTVRIGSLNLE